MPVRNGADVNVAVRLLSRAKAIEEVADVLLGLLDRAL